MTSEGVTFPTPPSPGRTRTCTSTPGILLKGTYTRTPGIAPRAYRNHRSFGYCMEVVQNSQKSRVSLLQEFLTETTEISGIVRMWYRTHKSIGYDIQCDTRTPGTFFFFYKLTEGSGIRTEVVQNSQECRVRI